VRTASFAAYCFGGVCDWSAGGVEPEAGGAAPAGGAAAPDWSPEPAAWVAAWPADCAACEAWSEGDGAAGAEAAGAGGAAEVSVPAASCFAQAVSISAATIALRASLVFIDRYPDGSKSCGDNTTAIYGRPRPVPEAAGTQIL
jgi:hypothetical protein